jgi:hydrogenase large subunit
VRGPIEEALIGTPVPDADQPLAVEHVVRSFDPCLVCTVHALRR